MKTRIAFNMKRYGGPNYGAGKFGILLETYLQQKGFEIVKNYNKCEYDLALAFQFIDLDPPTNRRIMKYLNENKIPIVQRIDGPGPRNSPQRESAIDLLLNSNITIFQSKFCKEFWRGEMSINKKSSAIIYNGRTPNFTDPSYYDTIGYSRNMFNSFSSLLNYHGDRRITPDVVINAIPRIVEKWPMFNYQIIGNLKGYTNPLNEILTNSNISRYVSVNGYHEGNSLDSMRRFSGVCFHFVPKDMCPNSVVECMSMGIPVIGTYECGTGELVGDAGVCISKDHLMDSNLIECAYTHIIQDHAYYVKRTQKRFLENFDIKIICKQYLDVIEGALNEKY